MRRSAIFTLVVLVLILLVAFLYLLRVEKVNEQEALETSSAGTALSEEVVYTDSDGNLIEMSEYLGQTMVVVVWASWCPDCVQQLRLLADIKKDYKDVKVVAFNRGEPASTVKDFLQYHKLDSSLEVVMDSEDHFFNSVSGQVMPETILFDVNGNVYSRYRGIALEEELRKDLTKLQENL